MKGSITITLFEIEKIETLITFIDEHMEYEKRTIGLHKNATRKHIHVALVNIELPSCKDIRKYYNRKGLREKLQIDSKDLKFSIYGITDEKYNEKNCLAYPLKEYTSNEEIMYRQYIKGLQEDEIESYRSYANSIYSAKQYKQQRDEQRAEQTTSRTEKVYEYLEKTAYRNYINYEDGFIKDEYHEKGIEWLYVSLFEIVCDYNVDEESKITFRWSDIPNLVYTFMYREYKTFRLEKYQIIRFNQRLKNR